MLKIFSIVKNGDMKKKLISVVVVTRNRSKEAFEAISSIYQQTYKPLEIILVDNASADKTTEIIKKKYPRTKIIRSQINTGGAGGRNLGLLNTKGSFILFMDDDAVADKHMIAELLRVMEEDSKVGIVQPKIYDKDSKNVIQGIGHGINLLTGRVFGIGVGAEDHGQYENVMDVPMVGCTWMVRRIVFNKVGSYDEDFFIPYEDSDFSLRTTKAGFRVCFVPNAKVWHSGHRNSDLPKRLQWLGITTPERAYRVSRNKIIFMKKHAPVVNLFIFLFVFTPIYTAIHTLLMLLSKRFDILGDYWRGLVSGLVYVLKK